MLKLEGLNKIICFLVSGQRFGIRLSEIDTIIRAVEITPVPTSPGYLCGIIDVHGAVVPVINMDVRIGLPDRPTRISDRFIFAKVPGRLIALRVDEVTDIFQNIENHFLNADIISLDLEIHGIVRSKDGLIVIYNLETFLSTDEISFLDSLSKDQMVNQ
jgi:purine-binding chemotaxis protein CheW